MFNVFKMLITGYMRKKGMAINDCCYTINSLNEVFWCLITNCKWTYFVHFVKMGRIPLLLQEVAVKILLLNHRKREMVVKSIAKMRKSNLQQKTCHLFVNRCIFASL